MHVNVNAKTGKCKVIKEVAIISDEKLKKFQHSPYPISIFAIGCGKTSSHGEVD